MPNPTLDLGGCRVTLLDGGALKLDGGAMFGIIPKPLWSRATAADDQNRIQLACNCLLVEWQHETDRRVLIETGHGPKYADKEQRIFAIDPAHWLLPSLESADIDPASITDVVVTHLHFDHAGGLTHEVDGQMRPTFPNARVHVQRAEYEDARANFGIMTATYRGENYAPIDANDAWMFHDGPGELLPGIAAMVTPGHTRGHQSIQITGRDRIAIFGGDVMPTRAHLGAPYNMAYDLYPVDNRASKERLLKTLAERDGLLIIDHEPHTPIVRPIADGSWFALEDVTT